MGTGTDLLAVPLSGTGKKKVGDEGGGGGGEPPALAGTREYKQSDRAQ